MGFVTLSADESVTEVPNRKIVLQQKLVFILQTMMKRQVNLSRKQTSNS